MQNSVVNENIKTESKYGNNVALRLILIFVAAIIVIATSIIIFFKIKKDAERSNSIHFAFVSQEYVDYVTNPENNINDIEDIENVDDVIYNESEEDTFVSIKIAELHPVDHKNISSEFFKTKLSDNEKTVYNAILYAYTNGYNYIGFSSNKFTSQMLSKATFFLMCDNPFIEINLERTILTKDNYVYLFFPHMTADKKQFNDKAYEEALKITNNIPDSLETEYDVAKYLYESLVCNTTFTTDAEYDSSIEPSLYHAITGATTNCDGFSNALSMLFNMAGIECFNVFYAGTEVAPGHGWCVAEIDGSYYHLDPSNDAAVYQVIQSTEVFSFFCASDKVKLVNSYYHESIRDLVPPCSDTRYDYENVDIHVDTTEVQAALNTAISEVDKLGLQEDMTDKDFFLINFTLLNGMEDSIRDSFINGFIQKLNEKYVVEGHAYIGAGTVFILLTV